MYPADEWFGDSGDCQPELLTADPGWVHDPVTHSWTKVDEVYPRTVAGIPATPTVRPHVRVEEMDEEERARIWGLVQEVGRSG
jgi:hypothetical protein